MAVKVTETTVLKKILPRMVEETKEIASIVYNLYEVLVSPDTFSARGSWSLILIMERKVFGRCAYMHIKHKLYLYLVHISETVLGVYFSAYGTE